MDNSQEIGGIVLEDIMPLTRKWLSIFKYKLVKILTIVCLVWWICNDVFQLIYCFKSFESWTWFHYGPAVTGTLYMMVQLVLSMVGYLKLDKFREHQRELRVSATIKQKIMRSSKMGDRLFVLIQVVVLVGTNLLLREPERDRSNFLLVFKNLEKYSPFWYTTAIWLVRITLHFTSLMMVPFFYFYVVGIIEMRLFIILDHVDRFVETNDAILIRNNIISVIKIHQEIVRFMIFVKQEIHLMLIFQSIFVLIFVVFNEIAFFSGGFSKIVVLLSFVVMVFIVAILSNKGQLIENLNEELRGSLYSLRWYEWNLENRKLFYKLLSASSMKLNLPLSPTKAVNHIYFTQIMQIAYALGNLLYSQSN